MLHRINANSHPAANRLVHQPLTPLLLTLAAGMAWQHLSPGGVSAAQLRAAINALVTYLLAPALILNVMLSTPVDVSLLIIPLVGAGCATVTLGFAYGLLHLVKLRLAVTRPQVGALLLATAFGNGLGMALPTVQGLLGQPLARVPMIYDVLLTIPVVWTCGVLIAAHYGTAPRRGRLGVELLRLPPVWVLAAAGAINLTGITLPTGLMRGVELLAAAAVPLFVLLVGLTLRLPRSANFGLGAGGALLKVTVPTALLWLLFNAGIPGLTQELSAPLLLTVAAPSVVVGIVLSDRFGLDSELFCVTLTLSTLLYVLVSPLLLAAFV